MVEIIRELGVVKLVQIQPSGLIIDTPSGEFYDTSRRVEVDSIQITTQGRHDGTSRNPQEIQDAGPFLNAGLIHRADLNGDGHQDFY